MALSRCQQHGRPFSRTGGAYSTESYTPAGYPSGGVICGRAGCGQPGRIWLKLDEVNLYDSGQRIFGLDTQAIKVRVQ